MDFIETPSILRLALLILRPQNLGRRISLSYSSFLRVLHDREQEKLSRLLQKLRVDGSVRFVREITMDRAGEDYS